MSKLRDSEKTKTWVETWKQAGASLEAIRRKELRAYDYDKNQAIIDGMLQWACEHQQIRLSSGLVEQQRLFMKIRKPQEEL